MSYFKQLRQSGTSPELVKELAEKLARINAETGIEDISLLRQMRIDTDHIAYTDTTGDQTVDGDLNDTDTIAYTDTDDNNLYTPPFKVYFTTTTPASPPGKVAMSEVRFNS